MRYAFHHTTVAHEDVSVVVNDVQAVFIKFGSQDFFGQSHTHCVGNTLSQWAGRGFHAVGVAVFRMAGGFTVQLTEVFQIINRNVVAGQVQQAIKNHGSMTIGEDKTVAVVEFRVGRVMIEELRPQHFRHFRHTHRRTRVARVGFLYGID